MQTAPLLIIPFCVVPFLFMQAFHLSWQLECNICAYRRAFAAIIQWTQRFNSRKWRTRKKANDQIIIRSLGAVKTEGKEERSKKMFRWKQFRFAKNNVLHHKRYCYLAIINSTTNAYDLIVLWMENDFRFVFLRRFSRLRRHSVWLLQRTGWVERNDLYSRIGKVHRRCKWCGKSEPLRHESKRRICFSSIRSVPRMIQQAIRTLISIDANRITHTRHLTEFFRRLFDVRRTNLFLPFVTPHLVNLS